jgi:UDP-4-amino-4,6-dideoxy-N-acetyl-beta-L-altrosamine transaminase
MSGPPPVLPYGRQWVSEEDVEAVAAALRSDWLTTGPAVPRFERALAEAVGVPHAVVLNSGTAALHAMYAALGVGPGDEVVTSPLTFAATANAAHYLGARVRFVDVEPRTGNLDPERLDAAIGDKTRLVVAVDFAGHPADYPALQQICDARGVTLVGDASHSLGARLGGTPVGRLCHATVVSMHPVKPITTGEGGAVLTADAAVARAVASFRSHGFERDPDRLENRDEGPWHVEQHVLGFNYRLTDIQAALGASQLTRLEAFLARRAELAARWTAALADLPGLILPEVRPGVESGWHLYVVRTVDPALRRPFVEALRAVGLGVQVHYLPVYRHPWYRDHGYADVSCPHAEAWYARCLSLPLYPRLSDEEHASAIERVREVWRHIQCA